MKLKAWQMVLILLVFGASLYSAIWAGAEWRKYQGGGMLRASNAGDLYVRISNRIFVYQADGTYLNTIDLARWKIAQPTGGFDVFANGDLLLLEGTHDQGFVLQLMTFLRMDKLLQDSAAQGDGSRRLVRCSPVSGQCQRLPEFKRSFTNTFRVQIDKNDSIFLADTAGDALFLLAADGGILDETRSGFRFPNQITLDGDTLLVANTNRNELTLIPVIDNAFAQSGQWKHIDVSIAATKATGHIWPVEAVSVSDYYYVLQQSTGMANGVIVKYGKDGRYIPPQFTMPDNADAVSLAWFDNSLLVADTGQMKIRRYSVDGRPAGDFGSPELKSYLQLLTTEREDYQTLEKQLWGLFAVLVLAGFVIAIIGETVVRNRKEVHAFTEARTTINTLRQLEASVQPQADDPAIHWITKNTQKFRLMGVIAIVSAILIVVGNIQLVSTNYAKAESRLLNPELVELFLLQGVMLLVIMVPGFLIYRMIKKTRVGVVREWVILVNGAGKTAVGRHENIVVLPNAIAIDGVIVNIGQRIEGKMSAKSMFDIGELQQWLEPRLNLATEIKGTNVLLWYIRNQPLQSTLSIIAVLLIVILHFIKL